MATYFNGLTIEQSLLVFTFNANQTNTILYTAPSNERSIIRLSIATCTSVYCMLTFYHYDGQFGKLKRQTTSISARTTYHNRINRKDSNGQDVYLVTYDSVDDYTEVINEYTFELMPLDQLKLSTNLLSGLNILNLSMGIEKHRSS